VTIQRDDNRQFYAEGNGMMYLPLGRGTYEGKWEEYFKGTYKFCGDGQMSGEGVVTYANGDKYEGKWEMPEDSDKFSGEELSGTGTFTSSDDGTSIEGTFIDGALNGKATFRYSDGRKFVGEYANGKVGKGTCTSAERLVSTEADQVRGVIRHLEGNNQ
jgi:hypothetical protein